MDGYVRTERLGQEKNQNRIQNSTTAQHYKAANRNVNDTTRIHAKDLCIDYAMYIVQPLLHEFEFCSHIFSRYLTEFIAGNFQHV